MSSEKINILYSLALNCPFNLKCANCPFEIIWKIDVDDRFDYLENLKSTEIDEIIKKHYEYFAKNFDYEKQKRNAIS
jgi:hypothetical protein